jgi:hypothetical protein
MGSTGLAGLGTTLTSANNYGLATPAVTNGTITSGNTVGMGTAATSANDYGMAAPLTTAPQVNAGSVAAAPVGTPMEFSGPVGSGGGASIGSQSFGATMGKINNGIRLGNAAYNVAANQNGQQTPAQVATRAPASGRGVRNQMPIPAALPTVANPNNGFTPMPTMGATLPTSTSSYQALLGNMLANSQNPMAGLGSGSNFMPGAGGSMNPSYLLPGMH